MGVREQVVGGRNWMQKVVEWIPGFRGYYGKEHRRDADRLVREAVSNRLNAAADALGQAAAVLAKAKRLDEVERAGRLQQRLTTAADRALSAARGYSGFFDAVKIREGELDRLYEHDCRILEAAERARAKAAGLDAAKPALEPIEAAAAEIERSLDARREIFLDLGKS